MKSIFFVIALFAFAMLSAQSSDINQIRSLLNKQTIAWNKGDLEDFMKGYWENDSLLFVGQSGPRYGYKNTLENYKRGYPDTAHMGKLSFDILSIKKISVDHAFVLGRWKLNRSVGDIQGMYTLLMRKIKGRWVIIADHSS